MKNAIPESHAFRFEYIGVEYAIGYQPYADALALSKKVGTKWTWVEVQSSIQEGLDAGDKVEDIINDFIVRANKALPTDGGDGIPKRFTGELKKLLLIIKNDLKFTNGKLSRL